MTITRTRAVVAVAVLASGLLLTACSQSATVPDNGTSIPSTAVSADPAPQATTSAEPTLAPDATGPAEPTLAPDTTGPENIEFAGGGTDKDAYLTVAKGGYFIVPTPKADDATSDADYDMVKPAVFDAMPEWGDNPPARATNSPKGTVWQAGDTAGTTTITTTYTKDGKEVVWKLKVTVE